MDTVQIYNDYTVLAGQYLTFENQTGFDFDANGSDASLYNYGSISVLGSDTSVVGVSGTGGAFYQNSVFWNEASATYKVYATGAGASAVGFESGSWAPAVHNSGTFFVDSAGGDATGDISWSPTTAFTNDGAFTVKALDQAVGVNLYNGGTYDNSGTIKVTGGAGATAVILPFYQTSLTNSGDITAISQGTPSVAISINGTFSEPTISNSGNISGDSAIVETAQSGGFLTVTNTATGVINGAISLGDNNDSISNAGVIHGTIDMGNGNDSYSGETGTLRGSLYGGLGDDTLVGGAGNDIIFGDGATQSGQDGNDIIHGNAGNDILEGEGGNDTLDGGSGRDTASYESAVLGVTVNLGISGAQDTIGAGTDTLSSIENLTGSKYADTLTGDRGANVLNGGGGNDILTGGGGKDTLYGEGGNDTLNAGSFDHVFGGNGNDLINFQTGRFGSSDIVDGGAGYDTLHLSGNYQGPNALVLTSSMMKNVEEISLQDGHSYDVTTADGNVAAGETLFINASGLTSHHGLVFNGAAETDGHFSIEGGLGADNLTGGALSDTFVYTSALQSTGNLYDTINAFAFGVDKLDVQGVMHAIESGVSASVSTATLNADLAAATGSLADHTAMLVTANAGTLQGHVFLVVDQNGVVGYQAGHDLVIDMHNPTGTLSTNDFV